MEITVTITKIQIMVIEIMEIQTVIQTSTQGIKMLKRITKATKNTLQMVVERK